MSTPNMNLTVPGVGTTSAPDYATQINNNFNTLDSHNHTPGSGAPIPISALDVNSDLDFENAYSPANTLSVKFTNNGSPLTTLNSAFVVNGNLYFKDGSGTNIPITAGGVVNATSSGISLSTYIAAFNLSGVLEVRNSGSSPANIRQPIDVREVILRGGTSPTYGLTLQPPTLTSDFSLTLPVKPTSYSPAGSGANVMTLNASGAMSSVTFNDVGTTMGATGAQAIAITMGSAGADTIGAAMTSTGSGSIASTMRSNSQWVMPTGMIAPYIASAAPTGWLLCDGSAVSRSTYAALFALIGTAYGYGDNSTTFNLPDFRGQFLRGLVSSSLNSISGSGSASSNNATFTNHGLNRTGIRVRLSSGTLSGLSAGTTYWAIVIDANTLAFATSLSNALISTKVSISGTNSAVLTQWEDPDASSRTAATVGGATGANIGSTQSDDFKSHTHTYTPQVFSHDEDQTGQGYNSYMPGSAVNTGSTGGNETRPINTYVNYIIKT